LITKLSKTVMFENLLLHESYLWCMSSY